MPFKEPEIQGSLLSQDILTCEGTPKRNYTTCLFSTHSDMEVDTAIQWREMVEEYTTLQLSFQKDIFPAISGLAKQVGKLRMARGECYVAGLRQGPHFIEDLMWHMQRDFVRQIHEQDRLPEAINDQQCWPNRPSEWRAPSWSWASIQAPVKFLKTHSFFEPFCEVLKVHCEPAGPDSMGELQKGQSWLSLKGWLFPVQVRFEWGRFFCPGSPTPFDV